MREFFIWLAKVITVIAIIFIVIPGFLFGMAQKAQQELNAGLPSNLEYTVGVVKLDGAITDSKEVIDQLYEYATNKKIKAIVLRVDSPGGAVGPSQEIYSTVKKIREIKPVVASMAGVAASGGLYSVLSASKIFCQPGTLTGSIGVILQFPNLRKLAATVGVDMVTVKSGVLKDVGNMFREIAPEERSFLEGEIKRVADQFIQDVSRSRGIPEAEVRAFADGRVIIGSEAVRLKLVDDFGGLYESAAAALKLAGVELKKDELPNLVYTSNKLAALKKALKVASYVESLFSSHLKISYMMP